MAGVGGEKGVAVAPKVEKENPKVNAIVMLDGSPGTLD